MGYSERFGEKEPMAVVEYFSQIPKSAQKACDICEKSVLL